MKPIEPQMTKPAEVVEFKLKNATHLDPIMEYCGDCLRDGVTCRYPDCLEEAKDAR